MKKKLSLLMVAFIAMAAFATTMALNVMAAAEEETTLFDYTVSEGDTPATATAAVGTVTLGADKVENQTENFGAFAFKSDGDAGASSTKYVKGTLADNTTFAEGDVITMTIAATSNPNGSDYGISIYDDRGGDVVGTVYCTKKNTQETFSYTVKEGDALVGKSDFYLFRATGKSTYIISVKVTRAAEEEEDPGEVTPPTPPTVTEVTDVLTRESLGLPASGTSYVNFSDVTLTSEAVYAGNAASNNGACIQLRSSSNAGIITTASGGRVKSIKIEWNSTTTASRTVDVYGSTTAYTATSELYNSSAQGTKIASFPIASGDQTIEINGDYQYIGLRSNNSALYVDKITIVWEVEAEGPVVAKPEFSLAGGTYVGAQNVEITAEEGANVYYTTDGEDPTVESTAYTAAIPVEATTTLKAIAVKDGAQSAVATATYTILESIANTEDNPYTVTQALDLIANKDATTLAHADNVVYVKGTIHYIKEISTEYGNATYSITDNDIDTLLVFRGKYLGGEKFTEDNKAELAVGQIVVVKGNLLDYPEKDGSYTKELATNNELVSIQNPPVDITIEATDITDGDITAALAAKTAGVETVGNITINLAAEKTYTITSSIVAPASVVINGAEGAVIDASGLTSPFIQMSATPSVEANEAGGYPVGNVTIKDVEVKNLKYQLFYANKVKYLVGKLSVENSIIGIDGTNKKTVFDFASGGNAEEIAVTNSTIWANPGISTNGALLSSQSGHWAGDLGGTKQLLSIKNSTLYNIAYGNTACTQRQNSKQGMAYDIENNVIVNCGKKGEFIIGLNGGTAMNSNNVSWTVSGNVFNHDNKTETMEDVSAAETAKCGKVGEEDIVKNSIAGVITFTDAAAGDFNAEMAVAVVPEDGKIVAGDPRWTITATQAPVDVVVNDADITDGNISTAVSAAVANVALVGDITINLAAEKTYTMTGSIVAPNSITINGNGATIDASGLEGAMITTPAGDLEEWAVVDFLVKDVTVKGLAKAFYASAGKNYYYDSFKIENSVVELTANITYFDFTKGGVANMTINNSTLYGAVEHTKTLYSSQSAQRATDYKSDATQTFAITNSTLYNLAKGANFFTHRQNSQKWLTYVLKNSVFVNVGKSGQVAQGLNGGGQSTNPTWDIDGNVYNFDGADTSAKENPANDGGESVKNSIAGVITFTDAAAGDFTGNLELPFGAEAPATQPGDPRWTLTYSNAPETFAITVAETANGTVTVDKTEAAEGETVTITATPSEGYEIDEIKVVAADETEVTVTEDNTFEMPAQAVTVTVTFKETVTDGIDGIVNGANDNGAWYNLNGVRVEKPTKAGIYIHNGKKYVIK